jgi:bidirectional [NiFe] hydrogenase diaphorase subunit
MYDLLDKIMAGQATRADLELLQELCDLAQNTSLCGLGQSAPNPVLSTLRYFEEEYLEKLVDEPETAEAATVQTQKAKAG